MGIGLLPFGFCTKGTEGIDTSVTTYHGSGGYLQKDAFVRKILLDRGSVMVDLRQVCKKTSLDISLVLREFYEMAGIGEINGRLVRGHLFKIEGSIEEIVSQLDKMFDTWASNKKLGKI